MASAQNLLFQPLKVGRMHLAHRVAMAPLTRYRADKDHVHGDLAMEYYAQRASVPGTLLVTEATFISPQAGGFAHVPGIYTPAQVAAWKRVTDAVHTKGSFIYLQMWALGRSATPAILEHEGPFHLVSASSIAMDDKHSTPRALTLPEISLYVRDYAQAAQNAIEAGFDGVEIHGANGYLIDQFLQDVSNVRDDQYGGSIENRSRFGREVVRAVVDAIGADRTGIRLSPWSRFQGMRMADPVPQFSHFIQGLPTDLAYIHLIEPPKEDVGNPAVSNDVFRALWAPRPFISASDHTAETARQVAQEKGGLIAFGRWFISNPDLPRRLKESLPLTPYNYKTFFTEESPVGFTDYPFASDVPTEDVQFVDQSRL